MTLESITTYWKRAPEGSCLSQQRKRGNLWLLQEPAAGSSCGWSSKENYQPRPMSLFFKITPLFGTIASWGFGVNFHHFEPEINLVGEKLWNKCNNQTRIATKSGLSLCTVTNVHHHCFELFCPYEELSFLFFFFSFFAFISCRNQTCCLSRVCCTCDSWGRGNWRTKDASSANRSRPGGHDWKRINMTTTSTVFTSPLFFASLLYNHLFHCIWHSRATEAWCNYKAVHPCGWKIGL